MSYVIFASYGNDSVALIQWAHERGITNVHVAYGDTGWAADWWLARVAQGEQWARSLGFTSHRIASEGMEALVTRKKAWPRGGGGKYQFCTKALKQQSAQAWLVEHDPDCDATCTGQPGQQRRAPWRWRDPDSNAPQRRGKRVECL